MCWEKTYEGVTSSWVCDDSNRVVQMVNGRRECVSRGRTLEYEDDLIDETVTLKKGKSPSCRRVVNGKVTYIC